MAPRSRRIIAKRRSPKQQRRPVEEIPVYGQDEGGNTPQTGEEEAEGFDKILAAANAALAGGKSGFSVEISSPRSIATYYYKTESGQVIPLTNRVREFRNAFAQSGDAGLEDYVLDYRLYFGHPKAPTRRGLGDTEMDIRKSVPAFKTSTVQSLLEMVRTAGPDKVNEIQKLLLESGYMDLDVYKQPHLLQNGVYDIYTQQAWTTLLKDAVMAGDTDVLRTLRRRKEAIDANGGLKAWLGAQEPERAPFRAELAAEEDIIGIGENKAQEMLGRSGGTFAEELVGGYHAEQTAAQRKLYDAEVTGGSVVNEPSVEGYAEQQLRERHGPEVGAYAGLGAFNVILQDLGLGG